VHKREQGGFFPLGPFCPQVPSRRYYSHLKGDTMSSTTTHIKVQDQDGVKRIEFVERNILDEANIQQIGEEIGRVVDSQDQPKVLISFTNVDHLSSAALGTLITINNKIRGRDGQLRLAEIDPQIYEVFVITKLNKLFQIFDTSEQAMASFA